MKPKEKVYAFIDSQNVNLGVQSQGWNIDFNKFYIFLKEKYSVEKVFLFIGYIPTNTKLYTSLQKSGYILVFKPVLQSKVKGKAVVKGNVDAELVLHAMIEYKNYQKAIIISGDGDFYCLVEYLSDNGKLSKVIVPNNNYSSLLRKFGSQIVQISLFRKKVEK